MSKKDNVRLMEYLNHLLEAISAIESYVDDTNEQQFFDDRRTQDAVIRNLEIIGEASNSVCKHFPEFSTKHHHVPWSFAYEMRNVLAHGYFKVDMEIVWNTIQHQLPELKQQIKKLIANA